MSTQRRYTEEEIAAIFERATESQVSGSRQPAAEIGMTLAQLHQIGREVGIPAELVTEAAKRLDRSVPHPPSRSYLGLLVTVGRTVELDRRLTDDEWERLVVDLRETFNARGVVRQQGSLRQWTNGNLQVLLEPSDAGHRIRLATTKGSALSTAAMAAFATAGGVIGLISLAPGAAADAMVSPIVLTAAGVGLFAYLKYSVPRWARERSRQMAEIADRLSNLLSR